MKSLPVRIVLLIVLCVLVLPTVRAQSLDGNIKAAKATAASGVVSDPNKLPDSLRWKFGGSTSMSFSQTDFSNWAAGGEKALALNSTLSLFANYKKGKVIWENNTFLAYGLLKKGDAKSVKNDDRINFGSRLGYNMAKNWYYSAALLAKTQFSPGYNYSATDTIRVSDFLAPTYLFLSLGLDYKPSPKFSMALSPIMGKATLVRSDDRVILTSAGIEAERIDKGKNSRYEFGGGLVFFLNGDFFSKKVTYTSQLELFSNYLANPENIDVFWDFNFRIALTRFVSAGVRLNMIYDDNQKMIVKEDGVDVTHGAKLQTKTFFEMGFFYNF